MITCWGNKFPAVNNMSRIRLKRKLNRESEKAAADDGHRPPGVVALEHPGLVEHPEAGGRDLGQGQPAVLVQKRGQTQQQSGLDRQLGQPLAQLAPVLEGHRPVAGAQLVLQDA